MSTEKQKTAVQELRDLHEKIKKTLNPSAKLIETLIKTGKVKRKEQTEKKVAKKFNPETEA